MFFLHIRHKLVTCFISLCVFKFFFILYNGAGSKRHFLSLCWTLSMKPRPLRPLFLQSMVNTTKKKIYFSFLKNKVNFLPLLETIKIYILFFQKTLTFWLQLRITETLKYKVTIKSLCNQKIITNADEKILIRLL